MGVEYDIRCKDCGESAGIGDTCSKAFEEMREIIRVRRCLERWSEKGLDMEISVGYGTPARPGFFGRHKGHELMVIGSDGDDYTGSGVPQARRTPPGRDECPQCKRRWNALPGEIFCSIGCGLNAAERCT